MREQVDWTIPLGTWHGMPLRLHAHFLLFCAVVLYMAQVSSVSPTGTFDAGFLLLVAVSLLVLYLSLLAHELGHWWMARRHGGQASAIVVGPLGGLSEWELADDPRAEIAIHAAGPLVNLGIALIPCLAVLRWSNPGISIWGVLDPLEPEGLPVGEGLTWGAVAGVAFWINWTLFVVNLFPAYPFDGGRILRATVRLSRPQLGRELAGLLVARLARVAAIGLLLTAVLVYNEPLKGPVAPWFALTVVAGIVWFTGSQYERRLMSQMTSTTWLTHYESTARPAPSARRRQQAEQEIDESNFMEVMQEEWESRPAEPEREVDEERRVDEVLARLHEVGLEKLTSDERALLERASARYRSRFGMRSRSGPRG